jgi:hypothetical protein
MTAPGVPAKRPAIKDVTDRQRPCGRAAIQCPAAHMHLSARSRLGGDRPGNRMHDMRKST